MAVGDDETLAGTASLPAGGGVPDVSELVAKRYRIVRWLGGGGMGRVYEAVDTELGERIALKVLRSGLTEDAIERFRREVKLTRRIRHRNVARMFDIGEHNGDKFLTMELVDGTTLSGDLGTPMPWARLQGLAVQLCEGLGAAHEAGVIHRDLKPDNVLVERDTGRVVITDFGIARSGDDVSVTQIGAVVGTPRYMAPEQFAGQDLDLRSDLFSLGVMLFELATGTRPWSGDNPIAIAVAQATQEPRPFTSNTAPAGFGAVLGRCLALEPDHRPANAAAVRDAIANVTLGSMVAVDAAAPRPSAPLKPPPQATLPTMTQLTARPPADTAIAVLPFVCAPADEYLADGLVEDLIDTLSAAAALRVRPAGAVRSRNEVDPRELGKQLEVDHVVIGSVRRVGAKLRVSARLIGVIDGFQIWAHRTECDESEVLAVSEQLGHGLATALSTRAAASTRPTDPRAVDLYLRARAELRRFWGSHAQAAADLLEQAADYAPTSPPILGALAFASTQAWIMRGQAELAARARKAIDRGLASGHGEAYLGSAVFRINQGDLEGGAEDLGTAMVRAPMSAQAHETAGKLLVELGAPVEGRFHLETAGGLDPARAVILSGDLARLDALEGDFETADRRIAAVVKDPDPSIAQIGAVFEARLAGWRFDRDGMLAAAVRFGPGMGENAGRLLAFMRNCVINRTVDAEEWLRMRAFFIGNDRPKRMQVLSLQLMAEASILVDQPDNCIDALRQAVDIGLIDITWMDACPLFVKISDDLRWQMLRDEIAARAARVVLAYRSTAS